MKSICLLSQAHQYWHSFCLFKHSEVAFEAIFWPPVAHLGRRVITQRIEKRLYIIESGRPFWLNEKNQKS